jgi:hypothetical protein
MYFTVAQPFDDADFRLIHWRGARHRGARWGMQPSLWPPQAAGRPRHRAVGDAARGDRPRINASNNDGAGWITFFIPPA